MFVRSCSGLLCKARSLTEAVSGQDLPIASIFLSRQVAVEGPLAF